MEEQDKVYCKKKYYEFFCKDNWADKVMEWCGDLFENYSDWLDNWLNTKDDHMGICI